MKRWLVFLPIILIFLIVSCGPSAETIAIQTAAASTAVAASRTKTPTPTLTHTPTNTPTPTMTPTITPTPLGGGSGQIACLNCINGIFPSISLVNPDGTVTTLLTDKYSAGASFDWSRNGARLGYFTITGITGPEEQKKYLTCVVANGYSEQCFEIGGGSFSLSPDGSKMAIGEHSPKLYLVDFDSGKSEILMEAPPQWSNWDVDWSPDGTKLVVAGGEIGITVINIMNKERFPVVETVKPDYYRTPRWSPDGKKIVYRKRSNLFIVNADGSDELLVERNAYHPIWSPDGTHLAYTTGNSNQQNIIMMNFDGTNKVKLTPSQALFGEVTWTSDGKFIIYRVITAGSVYSTFYTDLYKVEVANQKVSSLAKNVVSYTVSPDGSAIAFTVEPRGDEKCNRSFVMNMDGTILYEWKDISCYGEVGSWKPGLNTIESIGQIRATKGKSWEFEPDANTEGWVRSSQLTPFQVSNGILVTESIGEDPYMHSPPLWLSATIFSKIEIRMKVSSGNLGQIFFITNNDTTYDEPKSLRFTVVDDGQFHTYTLDMSSVMGWNEMIQQIRLDPTNRQAAIGIDYVRILTP